MLQIVKVNSSTSKSIIMYLPSLSHIYFKTLKVKLLFKRIATPALLLARPLKMLCNPIQRPKSQRTFRFNEFPAACT